MFSLISITLLVLVNFAAAVDLDPACKDTTPNLDPMTCCKIPSLLPEAVTKKCMKHLDGQAVTDLTSKANRCFSLCAMNETGTFKNNEFQADGFKKVFAELKENKEFQPILMEAVKFCMDTVPTLSTVAEMQNEECGAAPVLFYGCLLTQAIKNCPASIWMASDQCNQLKQVTEKCPISYAIVGSTNLN